MVWAHLIPRTAEPLTARAVEVLRNGGIVIFPTDTLYGLGADALNSQAVERVYTLKQRDRSKPLLLLLADPDDARRYAREIPPIGKEIIRAFWPGPLTLIFQAAECLPEIVTGGTGTIGLRCPDAPFARELVRALERPITATSANLAGGPDPRTVQEVPPSLCAAANLVIDAGPCPLAQASTVVDLTRTPPALLREGALPRHGLESYLR